MRAAVIPVKLLAQAKTRLSSCCTSEQRAALCLAMLESELETLAQVRALDRIFVTTPDCDVAQVVGKRFPQVSILLDQESGSLNAAVRYAARYLVWQGFDSMLFLQGDLPLVCVEDIEHAIAMSRENSAILMPDRHEIGTNGMLLTPPNLLAPAFGSDSFLRHLQQARHRGISAQVLRTQGLSTDVDTENDLLLLRQLNGESASHGNRKIRFDKILSECYPNE